jgi:hypothetical protein
MREYMNPNDTNPALEGRRFATTVNGSIGIVAAEAHTGDVVIWGGTETCIPILLVRISEGQRSAEIDSEIRDSMTTNGEIECAIHHCVSIGECFFTEASMLPLDVDDSNSEMYVIH